MNVQKPKENEIVLLSGLTSGNLQADFKVSQVRCISSLQGVDSHLFTSDKLSMTGSWQIPI